MAKLRPFRQLHENDVINLFAYDGVVDLTNYVERGQMVRLVANKGLDLADDLSTTSINNSYNHTISDRWSVDARVTLTNSGDSIAPLGMLLYDVKEYDENGEKLIWHPLKAHEMEVALSGQAVPVLTRGLVLVNGIVDADSLAAAGKDVYSTDDGGILVGPSAWGSNVPTDMHRIGELLGGVAAAGSANAGDVLLKLEL
jgi:hypothetical protein